MALKFPSSPSINDIHSEQGRYWKWDGTSWNGAQENVPSPTESSTWVRNPAWLSLPTITENDQKFAGLFAVFEGGSNYAALSAEGNYTVNWGDGSSSSNISSGVKAEKNIAWADAPATSDIGIYEAVDCVFTGSTDKVEVIGHEFQNRDKVAFSVINTTTGISTYTTYYVRDVESGLFKLESTIGGGVIGLTNDGTGKVYIPKYRQVIITVVPNGGNLTKLDLSELHSAYTGGYGHSNFVDIAISSQYLKTLRISYAEPYWNDAWSGNSQPNSFHMLEQVNLIKSIVTQFRALFWVCWNLKSVVNLNGSTAAITNTSCTFQDSGDTVTLNNHGFENYDTVMFTSITGTTGIDINTQYIVINKTTNTFQVTTGSIWDPITLTTNGSGTIIKGNDYAWTFGECRSLQTIPQIDTSKGTFFTGMFYSCDSLKSVPLIDTSNGRDFQGMFSYCSTLTSIPLLNTSNGIIFTQMFSQCTNLLYIPLINTSSAINLSYMFENCTNIQEIPLLNTSNVTNFNRTFYACKNLISIPLLDTSNATSLSGMFAYCVLLESVPLLDLSTATDIAGMFAYCLSLTTIPLFNTSNVTRIFEDSLGWEGLFDGCVSLKSIPPLNFVNVTSIGGSLFQYCIGLVQGRLKNVAFDNWYVDCNLSAAALNDIYTGLSSVSDKTIGVTGNPGTSGDTPSIATNKGWTVVS